LSEPAWRRSWWVPTLAAAALLALTVSAGIWQTHRAQEKQALKERYERLSQESPVRLSDQPVTAEEMRYRHVTVRGRFDPAHEMFVDNRMIAGKPGYQVVTPLRIGESQRYVLVDRGWVERTWDREIMPDVRTPLGEVQIAGIAVPQGRYLELARDTVAGKVWQNIDIQRMGKTLPYPLQPVVVTQLNDTGDGLRRAWHPPDVGIEKHLGYAFQWFAMATAIVVIYGVMYVRRHKQK
jgi:surfeit locus 1 family protein